MTGAVDQLDVSHPRRRLRPHSVQVRIGIDAISLQGALKPSAAIRLRVVPMTVGWCARPDSALLSQHRGQADFRAAALAQVALWGLHSAARHMYAGSLFGLAGRCPHAAIPAEILGCPDACTDDNGMAESIAIMTAYFTMSTSEGVTFCLCGTAFL